MLLPIFQKNPKCKSMIFFNIKKTADGYDIVLCHNGTLFCVKKRFGRMSENMGMCRLNHKIPFRPFFKKTCFSYIVPLDQLDSCQFQ